MALRVLPRGGITNRSSLRCEHVIPISRGGTNEDDNLCLSCAWCNSFKQSQTDGWDELTRRRVRLFHPRRDGWSQHFRWNRGRTRIVPITAIGRITEKLLQLNRPRLVQAREFWNAELRRRRQ